MKKTLLVLSLVICFCVCKAQEKKKVYPLINKDTINLRGYVFDSNGKPVKWLGIKSKQLDLYYNYYFLHAYTDTTGYFEIKGAKPNDTLTIDKHIFYHQPVYYNRGSRYIVIYLPVARDHFEVNESGSFTISHIRIKPKNTPSFEDHSSDDSNPGDFLEIHAPPTFIRNGERYNWNEKQISSQKFIELIRNSITYPESAVSHNIEGTVKISFIIERSGIPADFKVLNGIGYGCDDEVINAIKKAGAWRPAIDNGRPLAATEIVSVDFKLTDK